MLGRKLIFKLEKAVISNCLKLHLSPWQNAWKTSHSAYHATFYLFIYFFGINIGCTLLPHNRPREQQRHTTNHSLNFILVTCFSGETFYESIRPRVVKAHGMLGECTEWKTAGPTCKCVCGKWVYFECVCVCPAHCPSSEVISPFSSTPAQLAADKQTMANDLSPRHLNVTAQPATVPPQVHIPAFAEWLGGSWAALRCQSHPADAAINKNMNSLGCVKDNNQVSYK